MNKNLKKAVITLTVLAAFCVLPLTSLANANILSVAQGSFAPAVNTAGNTGSASAQQAVPAATDIGPSSQTPRAMHYESEAVYTGERISLDFQNADMHNIIRIIGEVSGKNIVVSDAVTGKVTLKLTDVPWDQALDIVLASRSLGVEEAGNVLTIYDLGSLNNMRAARSSAAAAAAAAAAQAPLAKKIFTPKYAPISMVDTELTKIKSSRGKIVSVGNDIYVEDDPSTINTMVQAFIRIDRVARQILIEARIVEATSTFVENLGIKWGAEYNGGGLSNAKMPPGESTGSIDYAGKASSLGFGFLNKANTLLLNATITASETSSEARTISAPRIMASNDESVSIKQGQQIPYTSGSSATTAANVQFKDVSMELKVTPHIEENGHIVTLDIDLKNDTIDSAGGTGEEPPINSREAKTKLMVKDGATVVIGGIIVDSQQSGSDRIPGLHRIPIMGWLFKDRSITNKKAEMLIFITANIIPITI